MSPIAPAVLAYSEQEFDDTITLLAGIPAVSRIQIDVVDGVSEAPASWPYTEPGALARVQENQQFLPHLDRIAYEIDLMCEDFERAISDWEALGASRFTLHLDALQRATMTLAELRKRFSNTHRENTGVIAFGVALHLDTDLAHATQAIEQADYVQCMGIAHVGKQGEPFDERVIEQVRMLHEAYPQLPIQVDGGETVDRAKQLAAVGATAFVVGSAILQAPDPARAVEAFDAVLEVDLYQGGINKL